MNDTSTDPGAERGDLEDLMARTCAGDRAAFADLYDALGATVYGMVSRILGENTAATEETTVATWTEVWTTAGHHDPSKASPAAWVCALAHRRAVERIRSHSPTSDRTKDRSGERAGSTARTHPEKHGEQAATERALEHLPAPERTALQLAFYQGKTLQEVAALQQESPTLCAHRIKQGLTHLRHPPMRSQHSATPQE
ncbi:sigma-70 family RNA polymerase sigma factor [Streptomyces sp. NPDC001568]|uniref:sigma-70 family RNA polymerase sigma factor n=1 Tax=Streptomyces sp. NPDC001568 TaxID=3364588 RepID=UPI0036AB89AE